jgi:putative endonuclease
VASHVTREGCPPKPVAKVDQPCPRRASVASPCLAEAAAPRTRPNPYYNPAVHFVYIVRCADDTLYTGYARDPRARVKVHNSGRGARYTAGRRPVRLVYSESFESAGDALRREYALKRRTRAQKEQLVTRRRRAALKGCATTEKRKAP